MQWQLKWVAKQKLHILEKKNIACVFIDLIGPYLCLSYSILIESFAMAQQTAFIILACLLSSFICFKIVLQTDNIFIVRFNYIQQMHFKNKKRWKHFVVHLKFLSSVFVACAFLFSLNVFFFSVLSFVLHLYSLWIASFK